MNNIKKILSFIFVFVFALVLIGCGSNEKEADLAKLNEQADKIYLGDLSETNSDIKLPKFAFGNKEFPVTWASDNTEVIEVVEYAAESADSGLYYRGKVVMALEETTVKLTATVTYKEQSVTREFTVGVLADLYEGYDNIAAVKAKDDKEKDVSMVKFSGTVSFTTGSGFIVTDNSASIYCYGSGHGRVAGEKVTVRGIWTFYNNMVQIKNFTVSVEGNDASFDLASVAEEKSIADITAIVAESVDPVNSTRIFKTKFAAKENAAGSYNTYKLVDPLDSSKFVDVTKYNDATTLEEVGKLAATDKFYEGIIIIYCSRSAGAAGLWDVLVVPASVKEVEIKLTDDQKVDSVLTELADSFNGIKVKENIELPTSHSNGATISWASNNEAVLNAKGEFNAPNAKTEVKLTATVTLNAVTKTVEITVEAAAKVATVATLVTNPQVGVAYKLGIDQQGLEKMLFATGEMSGYYGATVEEHADSVDVYLEATDGGYYVYAMVKGAKKYIGAEISGTHKNFKYHDSATTVWTYNTEYNTIICTVEGVEIFIGTRGTYNTIGGYESTTIAAGYPVHFYKEEAKVNYATSPEVGKAYKLGIEQLSLDKVLFATGEMSGYYGATTEDYAASVDVFFEATEGGYYVYAMVNGAKKYIGAEISGTHKNFKYHDAATTVWTFNTEFNTIVCNVEGTEIFIGTRGTYNTIGGYSTEEIAADFPVKFFVADPNGGSQDTPKPEPEVKEVTVTEALAAAKDLTDGQTLDGTFKLTAVVSEIKDAYSEQYKNISFYVTDGTSTILCYRAKGDEAANVTVGDTVVLTGKLNNYKGENQFAQGVIEKRTPAAKTTSVADILAAATNLGDKEYLDGEFTVSGTVKEITAEYSEQYKNISFILEDATGTILCYRVKGNDVATLKVGDTVTLTGKVQNYGGTIEVVQAVTDAPAEDTPVESDADAVITFNDKANRKEFSESIQVWEMNGIKVTNNVAESVSPVADYADPARFYKNTTLKIEYTSNIQKIVITTAGGKCYKADNTVPGAKLEVSGEVMTITLDTPASVYDLGALATQIRIAKIEIYVAK